MAEFVCNTSPIQYLQQLGQLDFLHALATAVFVPPTVVIEVARGRVLGIDLPDLEVAPWIAIRTPQTPIHHHWQTNIGLGERDVLGLGLEIPDSRATSRRAFANKPAHWPRNQREVAGADRPGGSRFEEMPCTLR